MSRKIITKKKRGFWKELLTRVTIGIIAFGIAFNTEARVTREVAEATIPYLLEAVGIPQNQQTPAQRNAVRDMIYTNDGQREMVDWARNGVFPPNLAVLPNGQFGHAQLTTNSQKAKIAKFFPYSPTNTFSSYASSNNRVGWHALQGGNPVNICMHCIQGTIATVHQHVSDAGKVGVTQQIQAMNSKLAAVLFILDICDTADQIKDILTLVMGHNQQRNNTVDQAIANHAVLNEYDHRPVSATSVTVNTPQGLHQEGDCVQTLYRHLINIAVQNDAANSKSYNIDHLPAALQNYYSNNNPQNIVNHTIAFPTTEAEAGRTELAKHQRWHEALSAVPGVNNISNGAVDDIIRVLTHACPLNGHNQPNIGQSNLGVRAGAYLAPGLNPTIQTSQGAPHGGTNQQAHATEIQDAFNALDGRCNAGNERFIVSVTDHMTDPQIAAIQNNLPNNTNMVIQIADRLWNRTITIGARTAGTANAHAEIANIN
jgi:hypothetical protein